MTNTHSRLTRFFLSTRGFFIGLGLILLFAAVSRFYHLGTPKEYYFDEVYHAVTSKLIAHNDPRAYEWWNEPPEPNTAVDWLHPPYAKYTQALSMIIFGENSFGWRFSSAVFGILMVAITALLAQTYFHDRTITLLAALLASLDGLLLAQSRIAMNDIHVTAAILLTCTLYGMYRNRLDQKKPANLFLFLTGIGAGLAMGSKWSGIYVLIAVWIAEGIRLLMQRPQSFKKKLIHVIRMIVLLGVVPGLLYLGSYTHMFLQGKSLVCLGNQVEQGQCYCSQESSWWVNLLSDVMPAKRPQFEALEARGGCKRLISHFSELQNQILWYQTHLTATHPYQSKPLQWIFDLRPVWQYVNYDLSIDGMIGNIYNVGNPLLFWSGLIAVGLLSIFFIWHMVRPSSKKEKSVFNAFSWKIGFLLLVYFIVWAPWTFSPRIMFFYHYAPAVPFLGIFIAFLSHEAAKKWKVAPFVLLCLVGCIFVTYLALYPLNTGILMPQKYFDTIFSIFPSWK